jgi:hypothetical protein
MALTVYTSKDNQWWEYVNPLRGMTLERIVQLLEQGERGFVKEAGETRSGVERGKEATGAAYPTNRPAGPCRRLPLPTATSPHAHINAHPPRRSMPPTATADCHCRLPLLPMLTSTHPPRRSMLFPRAEHLPVAL